MTAVPTFNFVHDVKQYDRADALIVRVTDEIATSKQLFQLFYDELGLPGYFGFNWNALRDCLRDFHGIKQKIIVVLHEKLPQIPNSEMPIYLDTLREAVISWTSDQKHTLVVIFSDSDRTNVEAFLSGSMRF